MGVPTIGQDAVLGGNWNPSKGQGAQGKMRLARAGYYSDEAGTQGGWRDWSSRRGGEEQRHSL